MTRLITARYTFVLLDVNIDTEPLAKLIKEEAETPEKSSVHTSTFGDGDHRLVMTSRSARATSRYE